MVIEMTLAKRKSIKLKDYDYSSAGCYFVTICVRDRMRILSSVRAEEVSIDENVLEFAENGNRENVRIGVELTECGKVSERELLQIPNRYAGVFIEKYVIMPDHIHAMVRIRWTSDTESVKVSLHDIICGFKSLVSRECSGRFGINQIFQRSYMEHIIRSKAEYNEIQEYISKNPSRWYFSKR